MVTANRSPSRISRVTRSRRAVATATTSAMDLASRQTGLPLESKPPLTMSWFRCVFSVLIAGFCFAYCAMAAGPPVLRMDSQKMFAADFASPALPVLRWPRWFALARDAPISAMTAPSLRSVAGRSVGGPGPSLRSLPAACAVGHPTVTGSLDRTGPCFASPSILPDDRVLS